MVDNAVPRAVAVGVAIPMVASAIAIGAELAVMDRLPDPVATHWTSSGPDGFSSPALVPWMTALVAGVLPLAMSLPAVIALRRGERGFTLRFIPGAAAGTAVLLGVGLAGSIVAQAGLESAQDAPAIGPVMLAAVAAGAVVGVLGGLAQSREAGPVRASDPAVPLRRGPSERVVWIGRAEMTVPAVCAIILGVLVAATAAGVAWVTADARLAIGLTGVAALLALLAASFTVFHVRVDASGLTVRSAARLIRLTVPASDVAAAAATTVSGLAQYGGFGLRSIPGATAVVTRSGPALEVTRRSGRRFVVTVDHPEAAAAVLAAVAEDARADQA